MNQSRRHKIKRPAGFVSAAILLLSILQASVLASENEAQVLVSDVIVNRSNIFDASQAASNDPRVNDPQVNDPQVQANNLIAAGVNRFHKTTLESVILLEAGISPGDTISVAKVAEVERRLRNLGIFASVDAKLVTGAAGVELHITTRDNFSIVAGASGSFLGGVGNVGFTVGEKNLFGTGNKLQFGFSRSTTDAFRGTVAFTDLHFLNKPWQADYGIGRTDEGDFYTLQLSDTFRSFKNGRAWSVTHDYLENLRKYYLDGSVVTQIPEERSRLIAKHEWRNGSASQFSRRGLEASFVQSDYSQLAGVALDDLIIEDRRTLYLGGLLAHDQIDGYKKVQGMDTLNFVQDVRLGTTAEVKLGVNVVEDYNTDADPRFDPEVAILLDKALQAGKHSLIRMGLSGSAIFEESGERPWTASARFKAYNTRLKNTTLAFNANYTTGEDGTDLPVQLTLGENNGLRGYDSRQFQGQQRLRMNFEGRYKTGWKLGFLDIGVLGFIDGGWAAGRSESSPSLKRSVGVGLRLASNALLGSRVFRIDLAVPLDTPEGDSSDPGLSAAVGQVFRF